MTGWTPANFRHLAGLVRFGRNPAATVYDSLGARPWAAPAPAWLNLGLWEGPGGESEAPVAVRRLVSTLASALPAEGATLDVGCGLGVQDEVISQVAAPRRLLALNITHSQLVAGRAALRRAGALPVCGDAARLPVRSGTMDGVISVEAAFHFSSRAAFFAEARRVLQSGGALAMSDVSVERLPRSPRELVAGAWNMRFWGLRRSALQSADAIVETARAAGFRAVHLERCGARVIEPAVRLLRARVDAASNVPVGQRRAARAVIDGWRLLYRHGLIDYVLLRAVAGEAAPGTHPPS
jgi:MPBQ/MSBQ methyltransferase